MTKMVQRLTSGLTRVWNWLRESFADSQTVVWAGSYLPNMKRYLLNLLISIDQMINTLLGGDPDETISSRAGKRVPTCTLCRWLCRLLDVIDPRHCHKHIEPDEGKHEVIR